VLPNLDDEFALDLRAFGAPSSPTEFAGHVNAGRIVEENTPDTCGGDACGNTNPNLGCDTNTCTLPTCEDTSPQIGCTNATCSGATCGNAQTCDSPGCGEQTVDTCGQECPEPTDDDTCSNCPSTQADCPDPDQSDDCN